MRVLGIDTAYMNCGFTLLENDSKLIAFNSATAYRNGAILANLINNEWIQRMEPLNLNAVNPETLSTDIQKQAYVGHLTEQVLETYKPDFVVMEGPAYGYSANTFSLGAIYGIIEYLLFGHYSYIKCSPPTFKYALTGKGRATKLNIMSDLRKKLGLEFKDSNMADSTIMAVFGAQLFGKVVKNTNFYPDLPFLNECLFKLYYGSSKTKGWAFQLAERGTLLPEHQKVFEEWVALTDQGTISRRNEQWQENKRQKLAL